MTLENIHKAQDILDFWFVEIEPLAWWRKDAEVDRQIGDRFGDLHALASRAELYRWRDTAQDRLAEIIILDQFSRNIHRGNSRSFAQDPLALGLAQEAVSQGFDKQLGDESHRQFMYMPYMHSESRIIHEIALELFSTFKDERVRKAALDHHEIIDRFGRYPHRNTILGRESTREELDFLVENPGF